MENTNSLLGSRNLMSAGKVDAQDAPEFAHRGRWYGMIRLGLATPSFMRRSGTVIGEYLAFQRRRTVLIWSRWGQLTRLKGSYIYRRNQSPRKVYATEVMPVY